VYFSCPSVRNLSAQPGPAVMAMLRVELYTKYQPWFDPDVQRTVQADPENLLTFLRGTEILGTDARLSTVMPFTGVGVLELPSIDTSLRSDMTSVLRWRRYCNTCRTGEGVGCSCSDSKLVPSVGCQA
jgi:hypothetical protein